MKLLYYVNEHESLSLVICIPCDYLEILFECLINFFDFVPNGSVSRSNLVGLLRLLLSNASNPRHSNPVHAIIIPVTTQNT